MRAAVVLAGVAALFLVVANVAWGQTPVKEIPATLKFEVATVKPAAPLTGRGIPRGGPGSADPGRVNYASLSVKGLLGVAYDTKSNQITGPAWIDTERYDILATVPLGATKEQVNVMLRICWPTVSSSWCIARPEIFRCTNWWWRRMGRR